MFRRMVGVLVICAMGVSGIVWLLSANDGASHEGQGSVPEALNSGASPKVAQAQPSSEAVEEQSETESAPIAGPRLAPYGNLEELERAALNGDASAQFRLSQAMRYCLVIMSYSPEFIESASDPIRREYLRESWDLCQHFTPQKGDLLESSELFEQQALAGDDPAASAMHVAMQVASEIIDQQEAWKRIRPLLGSNDPYVFWAVSLISMGENGETPESAAWRMLACENGGPPDVCTIMNGDIADACAQEQRCGNTGRDISLDEYYLHARPGLYDLARGRLMVLKDQLSAGRYDEISVHLP